MTLQTSSEVKMLRTLERNARQFDSRALGKYDGNIRSFIRKLESLKPTSAIVLARKAPRLLQLMELMGYELPDIPYWSSYALDFLEPDELGSKPVILDDVAIVGTSLCRVQNKIFGLTNTVAPALTMFSDSKKFIPELVTRFWTTSRVSSSDIHQFSSEVIHRIPTLGFTYDLDHPTFEFSLKDFQKIECKLKACAESFYEETISPETTCYSITIYHLDKHTLHQIINKYGIIAPNLFKIKVIKSEYCDYVRVVAVSAFKPFSCVELETVWDNLKLSETFSFDSRAQYRTMTFAFSLLIAETVLNGTVEDSLVKREVEYSRSWKGLDAALQSYWLLSDYSTDQNMNLLRELARDNEEQLISPLSSPKYTELEAMSPISDNTESSIDETFTRLSLYWLSAYHKIEQIFRDKLYAKRNMAVEKGDDVKTSLEELISDDQGDRLYTGITAIDLCAMVGADISKRSTSLAFDLAVDAGVQVPVVAVRNQQVGRVYRHGENVWDGTRLCAFASAILKELDEGLHSWELEKAFATLNVLGKMNVPSAVAVYPFLQGAKVRRLDEGVADVEEPRIDEWSPKAIKADSYFLRHGNVLGIREHRGNVTLEGEPEFDQSIACIYWLNQKNVLNIGSGDRFEDRTIEPNPEAYVDYRGDLVPGTTLRNGVSVFKTLLKRLPPGLRVGEYSYKRFDLLRFISSCSTRKLYLRSLAADFWKIRYKLYSDYLNEELWISNEVMIAAHEIYVKNLAWANRQLVWDAIINHFERNDQRELFDLVLAELSEYKQVDDFRGGEQFERTCLRVFLTVERVRRILGRRSVYHPIAGMASLKERDLIKLATDLSIESFESKVEAFTFGKQLCETTVPLMREVLANIEGKEVEPSGEPQIFAKCDIRGSSKPGEIVATKRAKTSIIQQYSRYGYAPVRFHYNIDRDDDKKLFAENRAIATEMVSILLREYRANMKYVRMGLVSSADTGVRAELIDELPDSPENYILAKDLEQFARDNKDMKISELSKPSGWSKATSLTLGECDKKHERNEQGIIVVANKALLVIDMSSLFPVEIEYDTYEHFENSSDYGWLKLGSHSINRDMFNQYGFTIFLYK